MTLPKHATVPPGRQMKAPYNFVPLPCAVLKAYDREADIPGHDMYKERLLTGSIDLKIETETYLYTRCAYPPELAAKEVHRCEERQQFFHHGDVETPVIPGSSIRGMVRALADIIGHCKMTGRHVHDEYLIYRDVAGTTSLSTGYRHQMRDENVACGYLHFEGMNRWIQPAEEHDGRSFGRVKPQDLNGLKPDEDGIPVWCVPAAKITEIKDGNSKRPGKNWKRGTLFNSGKFGNVQKYYVVFSEEQDAERIRIPYEVWRLFDQDSGLKRPQRCRQRKIKNGKPVFYLKDKNLSSDANPHGLVFLGPTRMFRVPYPHSTLEFVPETLRNNDTIDFSEAIFGTTSRKGRVRFSDAVFESTDDGKSPFLANNKNGRIVPRILSSPKPTSFQNYLVQPLEPSEYQGYDPKQLLLSYHHPYPGTRELVIPSGESEERIPISGTVIRGTKLYWNSDRGQDIEKISEPRGWEKVDVERPQNTVIRPVRPGTVFSGRIYFENLSYEELGLILTVLSLTNGCRHRLGMGKPYGMGRVKISPILKIEDRKRRYESLEHDSIAGDHDSKTAEKAQNAFYKKLKKHYKEECEGVDVSSIWDIPRLAELKLLLDKNGPACPETTKYVGFGNRYRRCWTERRVLPAPRQVWKCEDWVECDGKDAVEPGNTPERIIGTIPLNRPQPDPGIVRGSDTAASQDDPAGKVVLAADKQPPKKEVPSSPSPETTAAKPIKAGDTLVFSAFRKGKGWKFRAVHRQGEGSIQAGSSLPPDIAEGKEYRLTVVHAGNNRNKGMFLRWDGE